MVASRENARAATAAAASLLLLASLLNAGLSHATYSRFELNSLLVTAIAIPCAIVLEYRGGPGRHELSSLLWILAFLASIPLAGSGSGWMQLGSWLLPVALGALCIMAPRDNGDRAR